MGPCWSLPLGGWNGNSDICILTLWWKLGSQGISLWWPCCFLMAYRHWSHTCACHYVVALLRQLSHCHSLWPVGYISEFPPSTIFPLRPFLWACTMVLLGYCRLCSLGMIWSLGPCLWYFLLGTCIASVPVCRIYQPSWLSPRCTTGYLIYPPHCKIPPVYFLAAWVSVGE